MLAKQTEVTLAKTVKKNSLRSESALLLYAVEPLHNGHLQGSERKVFCKEVKTIIIVNVSVRTKRGVVTRFPL